MAEGGYLFVGVSQEYVERLKKLIVRQGEVKKAMSRSNMDELSSQERAGRVGWALAQGRELTVEQVMDMTGLGERAARELMSKLSRVLPVVSEEGVWRRVWGA